MSKMGWEDLPRYSENDVQEREKGRKEREREMDGRKDKRRKEKMRSRNEEANHGITG